MRVGEIIGIILTKPEKVSFFIALLALARKSPKIGTIQQGYFFVGELNAKR